MSFLSRSVNRVFRSNSPSVSNVLRTGSLVNSSLFSVAPKFSFSPSVFNKPAQQQRAFSAPTFRPLTETNAARVRHPAPAFVSSALAADGSFTTINFPSDYKGKWVVLFFYPLDFTFVCPTEIIEFSDRAKEFRALNCEVIGASIDSNFTHLAWTQTPKKQGGIEKLNIPLISDLSQIISERYGVLAEEEMHSLRGTFLLDDKGVIRFLSHQDFPVGRSIDEVLRLLKAFQFADKNGTVCPSGWQPGADTINPKDKAKYFEKKHKH